MVTTLTVKQISPAVRRTSYIKKTLHETENLGLDAAQCGGLT